jgi:hypothetical protein
LTLCILGNKGAEARAIPPWITPNTMNEQEQVESTETLDEVINRILNMCDEMCVTIEQINSNLRTMQEGSK